jgi:hypothetical protein
MLCCPVSVEVSAAGWSLVQRSPTVCLYVWSGNPEKGGQRFVLDYKRLWMNESMHQIGVDYKSSVQGISYTLGMLEQGEEEYETRN